ncbi:putative methyltransferase [Streptomyces hundungensis]|uniref:Putative methyltransferase n=1 Tax=Streptomyces hundungensis TaxID=1077946 RepID=A0A387HLN1_9ACTN|nr:class I SAM-dependent methyltransferase [Streptomyces hundungensis]AYG81287.1 putative methyltransferase [Streptomyces hundungensis]
MAMDQTRAHSFNAAAAQYAANRPSYPELLLDALEELAGRPLHDARVADIGAGTGIASALLHERGARVIAVEPGEGMAAQFRRTNPGIPLVRGDGNRLPLATASADFLTYAQAWHWIDPAVAGPEARRVLRPGGALALWWNLTDHSTQWQSAQEARLRDFFRTDPTERAARGGHYGAEIPGLDFTERRIPHTRRVPLATHLANLGSHSAFLVLGEERTKEFMEREHDLLSAAFPDGMVEETYVVHLSLALT